MNTRKVGAEYEERAASYLKQLGMEILERNFRTRYGEIDIIILDNDTLAFVEVKYRRTKSAGTALEAVDYRKRRQIISMAMRYLALHPPMKQKRLRFDCIGMDDKGCKYIKNAFDAKGRIT